jgi:tetratricopeptide (TPR) repeat protein
MTRALTAGLLAVPACFALLIPAWAQESEIIVIDPNHPVVQQPGTIQPQGSQLRPLPAVPAGAAESAPAPAAGVDAREVLGGLWFRARVLMQQGQEEPAARQLQIAREFMQREGLRSAPEIASALLVEGRRALEDGQYPRARSGYGMAQWFSPDLPAAHFGLARVRLMADRNPIGAASEWWTGLRAVLADPGSAYNLAGNSLLTVFLGIGIAALAGLLLLSLKSAPSFFHDLHERSSMRLSEDGAGIVGWALLVLPVALLVPVCWALAFWGALFYAYFRGSEKAAFALAMLMLIATGPVTRVLVWHFGTAADPGARALIESARQGPDLQHEGAFRQLASEHPAEAIFPFLLASAYRTSGRFDEAMAIYQRVLDIEPRHARALVNLGNLHALRQETAVAQTFYHRASEADPGLAIAHYDSHLAHLEVFHLEAADAELKEARRLDEGLITTLLGEGNEGRSKRSPQDAAYTAGEIWKRALRLKLEGGLKSEVARAAAAPATIAGACGLIAALLLPGIGLAPRPAARRCRRCGRPYCRRCQVTTKHPDVCSQCMHLFILRDGLAPGVKGKKLGEVARYRRRLLAGGRGLSLVLPGGGHILGGRTLSGMALLSAWLTTWIALYLRGKAIVMPEAILPAAGGGSALLIGGAALTVWIVGNLSTHGTSGD